MKQQINYIKKVNIYKPTFPLWLTVLFKTIFISFIICCAFVAVFSFIYIYTPVDGLSMVPTLNAQCYDEEQNKISNSLADYVYINRFASCDYGDIIVAKNPSSDYVVKRLIAKGGDKIAIVQIVHETKDPTYKVLLQKSGSSKIEELEEAYLEAGVSMDSTYINLCAYLHENSNKCEVVSTRFGQTTFLKLNNDEIFFLGDNRSRSVDCSKYGPVSSSNYVGRVDIIVHEGKNNLNEIFAYFWKKIFG